MLMLENFVEGFRHVRSQYVFIDMAPYYCCQSLSIALAIILDSDLLQITFFRVFVFPNSHVKSLDHF
ncbi:hypothetical protein GKR41_00784 [Candidatus Vallotia lariciata]|nr:hypothetical protein GKR41_00784 [Candidatus Vallotia lariciata]